VASSRARDDAGDFIKRGKRALEEGRIAEAEESFARAASMAEGGERSEALYLQAGVVRSGKDAEELYRQLLEADPEGEYTERARLELAKIEFSTGRYEGAYGTLHDSNACAESEEACLFEGMAAVMLRRYDEAMVPLERVRKGRAKVWAALSMAEASDGAGRTAEACAQYDALARARISPAAWYRHAECLEKSGNEPAARKEYEALSEAFPLTPEGVRATDKKTASVQTPVSQAEPITRDEETPRGSGYTIQFGSFGERANAIKLAAEIKRTHPAVRIDSELVKYREVFRVRYGFYATREAALAAAEEMSRTLDEPYTIMPVQASP
jgi:tetratricopeptide (TPR) repeat protein